MKQTLLFIGHDFHRHTKSNRFILDLIEKKFDVEICSFVPDYGENGSWLSSLKRKHYDVVLCWQLMPSIRVLRQFCSFDFGVFFPMADYYYRAQKDVTAPIWREYQDFQIISFSRKMHEDLIANGFSSHYFQYFPKPEETVPDGDPDSVFFWQRVSHINIYTLLTLLKNYGIRHLHIHKAVDPGETYIPLPYEYQGQMNVSYSSWFENKEEMLKCMEAVILYYDENRSVTRAADKLCIHKNTLQARVRRVLEAPSPRKGMCRSCRHPTAASLSLSFRFPCAVY